MEEPPVILKIFLIGFHHKFGPTIDFQYPEGDHIDIDTEHLPALCLPDQSHNFERDSAYFVVPQQKQARSDKKLFGVSCFRQISIEKIVNRSENDEFSRSSVQKSVAAVARLPMFGYIEVKLNIIVDKIFEEANFDCKDLLESSYNELNRCLALRTQKCPNDSEFLTNFDSNDYYIETCLRELITLWRHKILVLFKLLLLEKRVLFFGSPVKPVCATILSIISLHPELLNKGLCDEPEPKKKHQINEEIQPVDVRSPDKSPLSELDHSESDLDSLKQITILPTIPPSEYFAPLQIFKNGFLCLPFISLPYIDVITDKSHNGFVVGASNVLFQQKKNLVDVLIDVPQMSIDLIDPEMKRCLVLTTEDLRFFEHVARGIENPKADGYGTDSWIREQFESYFTSMLKTAYNSDNIRDCEFFNADFISAWRKTNNFQDWLAKKITSTSNGSEPSAFDNFPNGHPFSRQSNIINVSDVRNKIAQSINNTQSARKINLAVNNTLTNAKSTFSSWLSNFSQKEEITSLEGQENRENE